MVNTFWRGLSAFSLVVAAFLAVVCSRPVFGQPRQEQPSPPRPSKGEKYAYRSFGLPQTEPQLTQKLAEYRGEGWEIVGSSGANTIFRRQVVDTIDSGLTKQLHGVWSLNNLVQNGNPMWPPPPSEGDQKPAAQPPYLLAFSTNAFKASRGQGKEVFQEGTVQFLEASPTDKALLLADLLVATDKESPANSGFTVRCALKVVTDAAGKKTLYLWSGGYGSDRPENVQTDPANNSQLPAFAVFDQQPDAK